MKRFLFITRIFLFVSLVFLGSCREEFNKDFDDVLIINQPPKLSGLDTLTLNEGFKSVDVDLAASIYDQEGDDLVVTAIGNNPGVILAELSGTVLTITEAGTGESEITLTVDDGVDRGGPVTASFVVKVKEKDVEYKYALDLLSIPSGTSVMDYTMSDGTVIGTVEGGAGSDRVVLNGEIEWAVQEYDVMSITFPQPLNLLSDATLAFEYAGLWNDDFGFAIVDSHGGEHWFGYGDGPFKGQMVVDDPAFNKFSFNLAEYSGAVDLSSVSAIYFEKYEAEGTMTFKLRNLGVGIVKAAFEMSFGAVAGGTSYDDITLADGTIIGTVERSDGSSRTVQNGVLEWTTDEWDVMSITFPEPIDISANPTFSMIYADLWSDMFGFTIIDNTNAEAGFGWEEAPFAGAMTIGDSNYNTFSFDISQYVTGIDLTAVKAIYIEKFGASQAETFKVEEFALGK